MSDAEATERFRIEPEHPSLPGHFPGAPVVAGVLLLDRIATSLDRAGAGRFARLGVVKFASPLLPGQEAQLSWERHGTRVRFRIERDGSTILSGEGELA